MKSMRLFPLLLCLLMAFSVSACDSEEETTMEMEGDNNAASGMVAVNLNFAGQVNGEDFSCGQTYMNVGTTQAELTPSDFRLYVHDVRLLTEDGTEVPVTLDQDGIWQADDLAMLDFEDKGGPCLNGTPETRSVIAGMAPEGTYTGVRFMLGVPFEANHQDNALAPSPLNLSAMFWNWQGGYKFLRMDSATSGTDDFRIHLGSTGCNGEANNITDCDAPNRPEITLEGFDPLTETIKVDLGSVLAESDIEVNTADTPPGCMSAPADPECGPILQRLGINGEQALFLKP